MNSPLVPTDLYPADALASALDRISSQGLWLLLSLDQYGWRAELDIVRLLVGSSDQGRSGQHRPLAAVGHMFAIVDKLWRLIFAIRAHRSGREFLNEKDGYLAKGYKLDKKIQQLGAITEAEWRALLDIPSEDFIREHLVAADADSTEIATRIDFARELPGLIATNMGELGQFFDSEETQTGPRERTFSLRELDGKHRHGAPVVYMDCSPSGTGWVGVVPGDGLPPDMLVGVVLLPPDETGAGYIARVEYGSPMADALVNTSEILAALVHRLVRACLLNLASGLADPLASVADYDPA